MANYEFRVLSNSFQTKDNAEVKEVFEELGFDVDEDGDNLIVYSTEQTFDDGMEVIINSKTGNVVGAFNSYNGEYPSLTDYLIEHDLVEDVETDNYETKDLDLYIQEMLVENDTNYFQIKEVGHEKFRSVDGWVLIITPYHIQGYNLQQLTENFAEKSLKSKGNEHFDEERGDV